MKWESTVTIDNNHDDTKKRNATRTNDKISSNSDKNQCAVGVGPEWADDPANPGAGHAAAAFFAAVCSMPSLDGGHSDGHDRETFPG